MLRMAAGAQYMLKIMELQVAKISEWRNTSSDVEIGWSGQVGLKMID